MIAKPPPDARLRFDPDSLGLEEPARSFYRRPTVQVARDLVGAWIARRHRGRWYGARIVETEAYLGSGDAAAHSFRGRRTSRVEPMYSDGIARHWSTSVSRTPLGVPKAYSPESTIDCTMSSGWLSLRRPMAA